MSSSSAQFAENLERHVGDGLVPELALDLALHELVVAATRLTHASAAAVALTRGEELVCRATTGDHAPDLGVRLNAYSGLSGACVRSHSTQNCSDTESDERVDPTACRRLGIRSILVVPILEGEDPVGIIEVFSRQPSAFSESDEALLRQFALDCLELKRLAVEIAQRPLRKPTETAPIEIPGPRVAAASAPRKFDFQPSAPSSFAGRDFSAVHDISTVPSSTKSSRTDTWTIVLATLVVAAALALTLLIGFRTGWLRAFSASPAHTPQPLASQPLSAQSVPAVRESRGGSQSLSVSQMPQASAPAADDALVVYERGKVIFRSKTTLSSTGQGALSAKTSAHTVPHLWLAPDAAEALLRERVEPEYPAEARDAHRSGDVSLEVFIREDGSVASVRKLKGDPMLAKAAAAAVRNWRYEPYQVKNRPRKFQTNVTLRFSLSK